MKIYKQSAGLVTPGRMKYGGRKTGGVLPMDLRRGAIPSMTAKNPRMMRKNAFTLGGKNNERPFSPRKGKGPALHSRTLASERLARNPREVLQVSRWER
jgi:hypothetical protein